MRTEIRSDLAIILTIDYIEKYVTIRIWHVWMLQTFRVGFEPEAKLSVSYLQSYYTYLNVYDGHTHQC